MVSRAIGAPAGRLVSSLLIQVIVIIGLGLLIGTLLYFPVSQQDLGGIALSFETTAVVFWSVLLLSLGVLTVGAAGVAASVQNSSSEESVVPTVLMA